MHYEEETKMAKTKKAVDQLAREVDYGIKSLSEKMVFLRNDLKNLQRSIKSCTEEILAIRTFQQTERQAIMRAVSAYLQTWDDGQTMVSVEDGLAQKIADISSQAASLKDDLFGMCDSKDADSADTQPNWELPSKEEPAEQQETEETTQIELAPDPEPIGDGLEAVPEPEPEPAKIVSDVPLVYMPVGVLDAEIQIYNESPQQGHDSRRARIHADNCGVSLWQISRASMGGYGVRGFAEAGVVHAISGVSSVL